MTPSPENVHVIRRVDDPPTQRTLLFSSLDELPIRRLVSKDPASVIEFARTLAEALAGPERDAVRQRELARLIAVARTQLSLLEAMLVERLANRDPDVELIDKAVRGISSRLVKLVEAHRLESAAGRRPSVIVAHANTVNVEGAE